MTAKGAKYQKIIDWVKDNIEKGNLKPGDKLMSEKELSEMFDLSRQTVRHATGELVEMNLVSRIQGSGTYIGGISQPPRRERKKSIAVISTFYESYIFPPTMKGIESVLTENGYSMQVAFTDNRISRERMLLESLLEKDNVDGLIVEPAKSALPNPNLHLYEEIQRKGIPILFFNAFYPGITAPCVRLDDQVMSARATQVLIDAGHKAIAGIFKCDDGQGQLRFHGYLNTCIDAGLEISQKHVVWLDTPMTVDMKALGDYIFSRIEGCTGVVCYNDQVAYQLTEMALERGIRVPEELSVVGMDDSTLASMCKVPLTSFPHPKEELGRKAAENMLHILDNPGFDGNVLYVTDPVYRDSVKKVQ